MGTTSYAQVSFSYDAASRRTQAVRSDGSGASITTTYSYDNLGRVTEILDTSDLAGTLSQFTYAYDAASRVTSYTGPEGAIQYTYDATGQLTGASGAVNENFTYDPAGNRTGSGYQTGPANRLLSDGTYNYTYDAEGNLIEKTEIATGRTWTYTWDQRNRLTHVTVTDDQGIVVSEAEYTYDVFDRLIGRVLDRDGAGPQAAEEFWTLYDTPETAAEIAAAVYEPGTLLSNPWADVQNGSLTSRYLYTRTVDEVFARLADDQQTGQLELSWYLADRLGSVRQQVQTDGTILNEINYDSFGNVVTETNPAEGDRFKYTGREYDDLTGLYYYRARWYDARTGKFLSEDPLGFAAGDYNLSRYVLNNPVNAVDPSGEIIVTAIVVGGLIGLNIYVWGKNARVMDDIAHNRLSNPSDLPSSAAYWWGATKATAIGMAIGGLYGIGVGGITALLPELLAEGIIYTINIAVMSIFTYEAWYTAWLYYQEQEYFQAAYNFLLPPVMIVPRPRIYYESGQIVRWLPAPPDCSKASTLIPGPFARRSLPMPRGKSRNFSRSVRRQIDEIGRRYGCHTCGTKDTGTRNGHFIPDHQPPNYRAGNRPQRLYPHCIECSRRQGGQARHHARNPNKPIPRTHLRRREPGAIGGKIYDLLEH